MTVAQFAHKLKVNRSTVYRMVKSKSLPKGVQAKVIVTHMVISVNTDVFKG